MTRNFFRFLLVSFTVLLGLGATAQANNFNANGVRITVHGVLGEGDLIIKTNDRIYPDPAHPGHPFCHGKLYIDDTEEHMTAIAYAAALSGKKVKIVYSDKGNKRDLFELGTVQCQILQMSLF